MQIHRKTLMAVSLLSLFSLAASVQASQPAASGTIMIHGMIVNDTCDMNPMNQTLTINCPVDKTSAHIAFGANSQNISQVVPQIEQVSTRWIDAEKRLGVMTITYK